RAVGIILDHYSTAPSPHAAVAIEHYGGAMARVGAKETAFHHRGARYNLLICAMWPDSASTAENVKWARDLWEAMTPYASSAVYVNYRGETADEGARRVEEAYGPEKYERLVKLKNKYDPGNLFRLNQNIPPSSRIGQAGSPLHGPDQDCHPDLLGRDGAARLSDR